LVYYLIFEIFLNRFAVEIAQKEMEKYKFLADADQLKKLNPLIWNNYGNLNTNYIFE